jgi:hypothetical protein
MATADDFYKNPADGKPLVVRPRAAAPTRKRLTPADVDFAKRQTVALAKKGYSARQIARGLAAVGLVVTVEMVEAWL